MQRLTLSSIHQYEQQFFAETAAKISVDVQAKLKQIVHKKQEIIIENVSADQDHDDPANYPIHELRSDAGEAKVKFKPVSSTKTENVLKNCFVWGCLSAKLRKR